MYRLSSIIVFLLGIVSVFAQSPHGEELAINCAKCHDPSGWTIANNSTIRFDHDSKTDFKLEGAHKETNCAECHQSLVFSEAKTKTDCIDCHNDVHSMSVGNDCARCHTSKTWLIDDIPEVHEENGFPLIGAHSNLSCNECHLSENEVTFTKIGNECISCHQDNYASVQSPNHIAAGFSTNCIECHNPLGTGWETDIVDHDFFPLTLGHDISDCSQCHTTGNFSDASADCVTCHQDDYSSTQNPNHQNRGFSTDCINCHTTNPGWSPAINVDHEFFPLTLGHTIQDCNQCHTTGNFSDASPDCVTCHQDDYNSTQNPNHQTSGFSTDCMNCHTTNPGWTPVTFNDHDFFPLTLGHDIQDCNQCHTTGNFSDASPDCVTCHQDTYNATQNPNHQASGFTTDCVSCHTTNPGWTPATFNDHDFFPLTLGHDIQNCNECHTTGNFSDASADCVTCHQDTYNATQNPNHQASGFSTDCVSCHTTNPGWTPATFNDHDFFPLTLGHDIQNCNECHTTGNFSDASPDCVTCHQSDYNNTNNPNHQSAQFPTDCVACHTTNPGWTPADFDHDGQYFPIYSGKHNGKWDSCTECHTNSGDFSTFSCIDCHEHSDRNKVDRDHRDEVQNGYQYESNACLACHPDGREE